MPDAKTSFTRDIPDRIAKQPARAKQAAAVFVFDITGEGGGTWTVDLRDDIGVREGRAADADCVLTMPHETWRKISDNPSTAIQYFTSGAVQVAGNAMLAIKLPSIIG